MSNQHFRSNLRLSLCGDLPSPASLSAPSPLDRYRANAVLVKEQHRNTFPWCTPASQSNVIVAFTNLSIHVPKSHIKSQPRARLHSLRPRYHLTFNHDLCLPQHHVQWHFFLLKNMIINIIRYHSMPFNLALSVCTLIGFNPVLLQRSCTNSVE